MTEDHVIGQGDSMPWSVPEEYAQYLDFVSGQTVIMGRRTHDVFGQDVSPDTTLIVVSRNKQPSNELLTVSSLPAAIELAESKGKTIYIAGGSSIYKQAMPLVDQMYLSTIKGSYSGDAYFPAFDNGDWEVTDQRDEQQFIFRKYRRLTPNAATRVR